MTWPGGLLVVLVVGGAPPACCCPPQPCNSSLDCRTDAAPLCDLVQHLCVPAPPSNDMTLDAGDADLPR